MTTYYVDTDVVGGSADGSSWANAFASLGAYVTARGTVTLTEPEIVYCRGAAADTSAPDILNITTSAANYLEINVPQESRHPGYYSTSHYRLTSASAAPLSIGSSLGASNAKHYRLIGVQTKCTFNNATGNAFQANPGVAPGSDINGYFEACIFAGTAHASANAHFTRDGRFRLVNCIANGAGGTGFNASFGSNGNTSEFFNCIAAANGGYGFFPSSSGCTITIRNCYAGGNTLGDFYAGRTDTASNNYSSDGTDGSTTAAYSTSAGAYFTNVTAGSEDFHIGESSSLRGAGMDLSGTFTTDIDGNTRSAWDVGVDEYAASITVTITNADDELFENGESITIAGTGFGAAQGTGKVYLSPTDDIDDVSRVEQTVTSWSSTSITITVVRGSLSFLTGLYLFVMEDGGSSNAAGYSVQIEPKVYVRETLVDLTEAALASLTGVTMFVWRSEPSGSVTTPDQVLTNQTTDGNGDTNIQINRGALAVNDPVWIMLLRSGSPYRMTARRITPVYE